MLIAFALYGGMFSGMEASLALFFRWVSLGLGTLALAWPGVVFLRGATAALRARTVSLDMPIALGLLAGWASGAINTVTARGEVYFDTVTMLIFLLLVGRWIQHRQQRRASDALDLLFGLTPTNARLVDRVGRDARGPGRGGERGRYGRGAPGRDGAGRRGDRPGGDRTRPLAHDG